jgi:predicted phage-related endonuclease
MGELTRQIRLIQNRDSWIAMRAGLLGASEIAALFMCHPYLTPLRLWAEKSGRIERDNEDRPEARRGRIFESGVMMALREDHPTWVIGAANEYHSIPAERLGCTPDFYADIDGERWLIQAKIVTPRAFEEDWSSAPPAHFLLQLQAEMLCTGIARGMLAPLVFDGWLFPVHTYRFVADERAQSAIITRARSFWHHVADGREPRPQAGRDGATFQRMFPNGEAEPKLILSDRDDLAALIAERKQLAEQIKAAEARNDEIDGTFANVMRNHSKAEIPGRWRVSWPTIAGGTVSYERKPHRRFTYSEIKPRAEK